MSSLSLTIFGHLFDAAQLILSVTDAVSDAAVSYEFYENQQMGFFWATSFLLLLGSISDAIAFAASLERKIGLHKWYYWVCFVAILTPFAQILPVVSFFCHKFEVNGIQDFAEYIDWDQRNKIYGADEGKAHKTDNDEGKNDDKTSNTEDTGDAAREIHKRASNQETLIALDEFVAKRQASYLVANCQTLAESAPQCIVQLIAISLVDAPTNTQIISLSLSLFGVACKVFQVTRSFVPSASAAKLFFAVHDIFSISFLFSSLFSATLPKDHAFFGLQVCGLTWWWLALKVTDVLVISLIGLSVLIYELSRESHWKDRLAVTSIAVTCYVLGLVPVAIVQETVKLSWYLALALGLSPSKELTPRLPLLHDFLWSATGEPRRQWTDWKATFEALIQFSRETAKKTETLIDSISRGKVSAYSAVNNNNNNNSSGQQYSPKSIRNYARGHFRANGNAVRQNMANLPKVKAVCVQPLPATFRRLTKPLSYFDEDEFNNNNNNNNNDDENYEKFKNRKVLRIEKPDSFFTRLLHCRRILECFEINRCATRWTEHDSFHLVAAENDKMLGRIEKETKRLLWYDIINNPKADFGFKEFFTQIFTRKWPDPNVSWTPPPTKPQAIVAFVLCLGLTALTSLFGLAYPVIFAYHYFDTMHTMQKVCFYPTMICLIASILLMPAAIRYILTCHVFQNVLRNNNYEPLALMVDSYFSIPLSTVRAVAVPSKIIPSDCMDNHVLQFLDLKHVGLYGLLGDKFKEMEKSLEEQTSLIKED